MVKLIHTISGKGHLNYRQWPKETREVETGDYISDISKIKKDLGFVPKINFQQGLKKSIITP
jgi:nucleoside-diphosphate-sugar epimerase